MKGNCGECLSRWYCDINPDECDAWPDPVPQTNADHIRSMSDEELVYLLHDYYCEGHADGLHHIYDAMPISDVREWLNRPYKEDT